LSMTGCAARTPRFAVVTNKIDQSASQSAMGDADQ
jgi:hypothetical protein